MKIFKPGDVITREGAVDKELFILISGRIGVFKSEVKVAEFSEKGMVIGEMSIINCRGGNSSFKFKSTDG